MIVVLKEQKLEVVNHPPDIINRTSNSNPVVQGTVDSAKMGKKRLSPIK